MSRLSLLMVFALILGCSAQPRATRAAAVGGIGINLSPVAAIYPQTPFVDVFKEAQPWNITKQWSRPGAAIVGVTRVGPDGWIRSLASDERGVACALQGVSGHYPAGMYTLYYSGEGTLTFNNVVQVVTRRPHEMKLMVDPTKDRNGICIFETWTSDKDPIRDIRLIMPGFEKTYQSDPFYPPFLELLKPFKVLRLIGWDQANRSEVVEWSERRPMTYATQAWSTNKTAPPVAATGVAYEYQIDLANRLGKDPWFLIPTKASDDYISSLARLVHEKLRPDLHPFVEFSNEIWNHSFSDAGVAIQSGLRDGLDSDANPNTTKAGYYWYARRASRAFDLWNAAFGRDAPRIVHVISGWQSVPSEADTILGYEDTYKKADLLAVAAYAYPFNFWHIKDPAKLDEIRRMSVDDVLGALNRNIQAVLPQQLAGNTRVAAKYGLPLAIYEGGLDMSTNVVPEPYRTPITATMVPAGQDPRIEQAYTALLDQLLRLHVEEFNHFVDLQRPAAFGSYGLLSYQMQPPEQSPKFRALAKFIADHPNYPN